MSSKPTRPAMLRQWLDELGPRKITPAEWAQARTRLAPVSDAYLRRLLRASGAPLAPLVEGVRQDSPAELERTLLALEREYAAAVAAGDRQGARACRRLVIDAKDHARLALRRRPDKKPEKDEMILWMLTWLENPGVFPEWVEMRKRALREPTSPH